MASDFLSESVGITPASKVLTAVRKNPRTLKKRRPVNIKS